ncbi:hypothetical protein HKD37_04G010924 [Glycine soja]
MRTSAISLFTKLQQWDCLIPATLALTFASTSGCDSSNATAHRSDEVDASCAMKRKSKRYPPISASMENDDDMSPEMDCGRRSDTESWSTQAWGNWGYNTQKEREEVAAIPRIHVLELSDFSKKLK